MCAVCPIQSNARCASCACAACAALGDGGRRRGRHDAVDDDAAQGGVSYEILDELGRTRRGVRGRRAMW